MSVNVSEALGVGVPVEFGEVTSIGFGSNLDVSLGWEQERSITGDGKSGVSISSACNGEDSEWSESVLLSVVEVLDEKLLGSSLLSVSAS